MFQQKALTVQLEHSIINTSMLLGFDTKSAVTDHIQSKHKYGRAMFLCLA